MFSYILSLFRSPNPELSVEDAVKILTETDGNQDGDDFSDIFALKTPEKQFKDEYNFSTNIGTITRRRGEKYIIDGLYEFCPDAGQEFDMGDSVSYQKLASEDGIAIYNVNLVNKDWDTVMERKSIATTRIMIGKVEKREKRILHIFPGDIKVDLDKTTTEFIPYVGDWLEIDVKYEVDEQSLDLSGQIIEVNKIIPIRPHIETGKISHWDQLEQCGTISQKIFFDKNSLSCGYVPIVGDAVITEIIESDQNKCNWRALKVLPKLVNDLCQNHCTSGSSDMKKIEENHPGLEISNCQLKFDKLGETKQFNVILTNNSNEVFKLLNVYITENSFRQLVFAEDSTKSGDILPNTNFTVKFRCTSKTMGTSNEFLEFDFQKFAIGKYVNVTVELNTTCTYYKKNHSVNYQNSYNDNRSVIKGQKRGTMRFQAAKLPSYPVPKHLLDLVIKYSLEKDNINLVQELKVLKRSLFTNLNGVNYEEKFHTLLHLDEIENILCIRQYDQDRTCFIANNEFLMMEVENLAERRPSIVLGDKIMARDPLGMSLQEYEGNVFKVGAKHVYLKFSGLFHDTYKGEDYSVRVVPGRASYRRQHHAVYMVARNLGKEWLFPNQVLEKPSQVRFCYNVYLRDIKNSLSPEVKPSPTDLLQNALKSRTLHNQDGKETQEFQTPKLEWYNRHLNCKQKDAIINILKGVARPLPYIIFGPPGTGKTVTLIESILQVLRMKPECRILVTAPSNSAADLIALRLINFGVLKPGDLVRLVSINYAVGDHIPAKLAPYCATGSYSKEGTAEENVLGRNGMTLDCSRTVLGRHKITVSTCSAAGVLHTMGFSRGHFTHIYVDEAGQAAEPEVMISISLMDKYYGQIILAGDPMQLGPVILSNLANECGLSESYLERLINRFPYLRDIQGFPETEGYDPRLVTKLLHNYRSLEPILNIFSRLFYHGELIPTVSSTNSKESQLLNSLESILPKTLDGRIPSIVFHGVEGENYQNHDSPSWCNFHEAAQVFYYINELYRLGVKPENIGIITQYIKQVREIKRLFSEAEFDAPKTGTVEDFQGQEFDVVLLSTVRSTRDYVAMDVKHSLGFVSSPRRLNVAISRPKALLVIIGNPTLLSCDTYWRNVIDYCMKHGAYIGCNFGNNCS